MTQKIKLHFKKGDPTTGCNDLAKIPLSVTQNGFSFKYQSHQYR